MANSPDPYEAFARTYEQDSHIEVARAFFAAIRPLLRRSRSEAPVLDLGCGSGLVTASIAQTGRSVIGIDQSRSMLALARRRCAGFDGRVRFVRSGLDAFPSGLNCALAVACGDIVNHISSLAYLRRMFTRTRACLLPGGLLIFDALNRFCFEAYWAGKTYLMEGPTGDLVMECDWQPRTRRASARMIAYVQDGGRRFIKRETTLFEYLHEDRELSRALRAAGFHELWRREWSPWSDQDREPSLDRGLWCARNAGALEGIGVSQLRELGFERVR
jgi:SAM-dependent methyltransferase